MSQGLFVLDLDRCTGCAACVLACNNENPVAEDLSWREIFTFNETKLPLTTVFHYSLACNHCLSPACLLNCPANAYAKNPETGAVVILPERCIGCRYCSWVCPYGAPKYNDDDRVMEKCTFCDHLQESGHDPACVAACPLEALSIERNAKPPTIDRPGFPDTGLEPAVRLVTTRRQAAPLMTAAPEPLAAVPRKAQPTWNGLREEWSLWVFTSIATLLVAWFTAATVLASSVVPLAFAGAGVAAMTISVLHLGKFTRIWRAILNFRGSWISREVVLFSAFLAGGTLLTIGGARAGGFAMWAISIVGFCAMLAMDMVYRVRGQPTVTVPHSAMASLTAAYYLGLLTGFPTLAWPVAALKAVLYLARRDGPVPGRWALAAARIGIGLAVPGILLTIPDTAPWAVVAAALVGELVDRAEFYAGLRFLTPRRQIDHDLARASSIAS